MHDAVPGTSEQEHFWRGPFGNDYLDRNSSTEAEVANLWFFANALRSTDGISSVLEVGANYGPNLEALTALFPQIDCHAVEINAKACEHLRRRLGPTNVTEKSLLSFDGQGRTWDLVVAKLVLIHVHPSLLSRAYEVLMSSASRYILVAEYYSPFPQEVEYRGYPDRLFKRDFAGDLLDSYPNLRLRDYGFAYHRDTTAPQDDVSWFLLEVVPPGPE